MTDPQAREKNRIFNLRLMVNDETVQTMEEKQHREAVYETMQLCTAHLPNNSDHLESGDVSSESSDIGPCLMCVARRIPHNEKPITSSIQQFTVKLDPSGKILAVDCSWLTKPYTKYINEVKCLLKTL